MFTTLLLQIAKRAGGGTKPRVSLIMAVKAIQLLIFEKTQFNCKYLHENRIKHREHNQSPFDLLSRSCVKMAETKAAAAPESRPSTAATSTSASGSGSGSGSSVVDKKALKENFEAFAKFGDKARNGNTISDISA